MSLHLARLLSSGINPLLVLLLLAASLDTLRKSEASPGSRLRMMLLAWVRCALAIAVPVLMAEAGKKYEIWAGHPWFPSGHETFAVAAGTCLVLLYGQTWLTAVLPAALLMGWGLVRAGYHQVPDVVGAAIFAPPVAALLLRLTVPVALFRRSNRSTGAPEPPAAD